MASTKGTKATPITGSGTVTSSSTVSQSVVVLPTLPMQLMGQIPLTDDIVTTIAQAYLPAEAIDYGWDEAMIRTRWAGSIASTVRLYWLMRVNDTASYIDISEPGGSFHLTQQWQQAKAMLTYWDGLILVEKEESRKFATASFGTIRARRRGGSNGSCCC